jgi:hypothetical protein
VLLTPAFGFSTTVSINDQCQSGASCSADTLNAGGSTGSTLNTIYTFANGDQYFVTGMYGASYTGGTVNIAANPTAQYLGNIANKTATSQADILTFNFFQNFNYTSGSLDGYYYYYAQSDTMGGIAANSTYTINLSWDGQQIGPSTYGVGYSGTNLFNQKLYSGLTNPLAADEFISMSFGAGSDPGATFETVTPEPSSILLLSFGGLLMLGFAVKNGHRKTAIAVRS